MLAAFMEYAVGIDAGLSSVNNDFLRHRLSPSTICGNGNNIWHVIASIRAIFKITTSKTSNFAGAIFKNIPAINADHLFKGLFAPLMVFFHEINPQFL